MKGILTLKKSTIIVAVCMAVLCLPSYSEPTPEQVKERTKLLVQAVQNNNVEQAKVCIKFGANVNAKDNNGRTALMFAASADTAELLIKAGADVNAKDNNGRTALMFAASADTAELLIKAGADVNTKNGNGWSALRFATSKYLNHYYDTNIKDNIYKDMAELLIKAGADVDSELIYEIQNGSDTNYTNCVELLLQLGANPNATDSEGISALDNAILYGKNDIADLLRAAGAKE